MMCSNNNYYLIIIIIIIIIIILNIMFKFLSNPAKKYILAAHSFNSFIIVKTQANP